jgi:hypothetical protein
LEGRAPQCDLLLEVDRLSVALLGSPVPGIGGQVALAGALIPSRRMTGTLLGRKRPRTRRLVALQPPCFPAGTAGLMRQARGFVRMQLQFSIGRRLIAFRGVLVAVGGQLVAFGELPIQIGEALVRIGRGLILIGRRLILGGSSLLLGEPGQPPLLFLQPGPVLVPLGPTESLLPHSLLRSRAAVRPEDVRQQA